MGRCNQKRVASHIRSGRLAAQKVCIISLNAHTLFAVRRSPLSVGSVTLERGHAPTTSLAGSSESFPIASAKQNNTYRRKCDAPFFEKCGAPSVAASLLAAVQASTISVIAVREKKKASAWAQISLGEKKL
ncbi:hypothetical protein MRX96_030286 [Rhipicephalus microplus]